MGVISNGKNNFVIQCCRRMIKNRMLYFSENNTIVQITIHSDHQIHSIDKQFCEQKPEMIIFDFENWARISAN